MSSSTSRSKLEGWVRPVISYAHCIAKPLRLGCAIAGEFAKKKVKTEDFAKKLMGQIVFLYFLQKKGWLGVPKGGDWGGGPHNFLRQLFDGRFRIYKNFFNDILEHLFYDTLATERGHDATPSEADIKVTRDLIRAGQLLKIEVLDHVVMGRPDFRSLRTLGYFYN